MSLSVLREQTNCGILLLLAVVVYEVVGGIFCVNVINVHFAERSSVFGQILEAGGQAHLLHDSQRGQHQVPPFRENKKRTMIFLVFCVILRSLHGMPLALAGVRMRATSSSCCRSSSAASVTASRYGWAGCRSSCRRRASSTSTSCPTRAAATTTSPSTSSRKRSHFTSVSKSHLVRVFRQRQRFKALFKYVRS